MYLNDIHILAYIIALLLGIAIGYSIDLIGKKIVNKEKIFTRKTAKELLKNYFVFSKLNCVNAVLVVILYMIVLIKNGINSNIIENIELAKCVVLIPCIIAIIEIDYKDKIIPNRLLLFLFEAGIIFTFAYSVNSLFIARDYLIAMVLGFAIFGIISLLGRLIAGKEAMGMGDVKLLGVLGLFFGIPLTIAVAIISFVVSAIVSIVEIASKRKKKKEYIPFGPCVGIATVLCIIIPQNLIISALLTIFTLGKVRK